jgi:hypothetical protein
MEDKVESTKNLEALCFRRAIVKDNDRHTLLIYLCFMM